MSKSNVKFYNTNEILGKEIINTLQNKGYLKYNEV